MEADVEAGYPDEVCDYAWDYLFDENGKGKWMEFDKVDIISLLS